MDNDNPTTPESREDWAKGREDAGKHVAETKTTETTTETSEVVEPADDGDTMTVPDNDDVEPGNEPQPESADGNQDDPDDDPVTDPIAGDDEYGNDRDDGDA